LPAISVDLAGAKAIAAAARSTGLLVTPARAFCGSREIGARANSGAGTTPKPWALQRSCPAS